MKNKPTHKDLCVALSKFFIDNEIDYKFIVKTTKYFEISYVENTLFDLVAPVLWTAYFEVAPAWVAYDPDWLWDEIQKVSNKNKEAGFIGKKILKFRRFFMVYLLKDVWQEFLKEYSD